MSRTERFEVEGSPRVYLRLPAGEARVVAGDEGVITIRLDGRESVLGRFVVARRGDQVVVEPDGGRLGRWSRVDVEIQVGTGADIHARLASGDVDIAIPIAQLTVESGAGDVKARGVGGDARIRTASGDIVAGPVDGRLDAATAAGDIRIEAVVGGAALKTASGDIAIGEAGGEFTAHSASGDITLRRFLGDSFDAKTMSGDVHLGLIAGRRFAVNFSSLSGDIRTDFPVGEGSPEGRAARLTVRTMSGDIVVRATP
jgi:DUF4097 and DUF4098 domain-containing protein YvlB